MSFTDQLDVHIVILSIIVAIIGAYASLDIISKVYQKRMNGLFTGSIMMGMSICAMHFIGMLARNTHEKMMFNTPLVAGAFMFSILLSFLSFYLLEQLGASLKNLFIASLVMSLSISGMHFIGTLSMYTYIRITYDVKWMFLAILLAWLGSYFAFILSFYLKKQWFLKHLISGGILGIGVTLMHYITMGAITIHENESNNQMIGFKQFSRHNLAFALGIAVLVLIGLIVLFSYLNKYALRKFKETSERTHHSDLRKYKERIKKAQRDLYETIRNQQGMIFKYIKIGDQFVHTICDGDLLYRLGGNPSKVIGKSVFDFLPEYMAKEKVSYYHLAWAGEQVSYEGHLNGIDYLCQLRPVIVNGEVQEVIGSCIDITDKNRAEKKLRYEKEFYQHVLSMMSEAIFVYSAKDEEKIVLNKNVYEFMGIDETAFTELTLADASTQFLEEDGRSSTPESTPISYTLTTGKPLVNKVLGLKRKDSNPIWLSVNTRLLKDEDDAQNSRVMVTMSDITEQKNQENIIKENYALVNTILNSLYIGVLIVAPDGKIVFVNESFCEMFQIDQSAEEMVGQHISTFHAQLFKHVPEGQSRIEEILKKNKDTGDEIRISDKRVIYRKYSPFQINNELQDHLWTFEDITSRKRLEDEIIRSKEDAVKASQAKSEFLSKMSHELRTPLNGILGFSQLLELDRTLNQQQQSFVQEILRGGRHLLNLINEVLDLSRIESGKLKVNIEEVNIVNILTECINMLQPLANRRNIRIYSDLTNALDIFIFGDPLRIKQIFINLIDNAIKYNHQNGEVFIHCERRNGEIVFRIKDTGIGISEKEQPNIFEPFYRAKNIKVEGTGIGLSLVKQLVELMNGTIGFASEQDNGSEFWFSIPIDHMPNRPSATIMINQTEIIPQEHAVNILYIEDNHSNIQLIQKILQRVYSNLFLQTALTGEEGIERIRKEEFDLILLDINLPDMSGYDVMKKIQTMAGKKRQPPVIALSAYAMAEDINRAYHEGFSDFIVKPIIISDFLGMIKKYLK